jgi:SAM-dependent methyltransferase
MERENYFQIALLERDNWWYRSRRDLLDRFLRSMGIKFRNTLDAGCGVGSNAEVLLKHSDNVYGIDASSDAVALCSGKGYKRIITSSILDFVSDVTFDLIACMDVFEHVDDAQAIKSLRSHLSDNGIMIFSVPAHKHLWNTNDDFSRHIRRYELGDIYRLVEESDLEPIKLSYWNQFMYVPTAIYSGFSRITSKYMRTRPQNNLNLIPKFLNNFLFCVLKIENGIFLRHDLIAGVSIVCVCKKRGG